MNPLADQVVGNICLSSSSVKFHLPEVVGSSSSWSEHFSNQIKYRWSIESKPVYCCISSFINRYYSLRRIGSVNLVSTLILAAAFGVVLIHTSLPFVHSFNAVRVFSINHFFSQLQCTPLEDFTSHGSLSKKPCRFDFYGRRSIIYNTN